MQDGERRAPKSHPNISPYEPRGSGVSDPRLVTTGISESRGSALPGGPRGAGKLPEGAPAHLTGGGHAGALPAFRKVKLPRYVEACRLGLWHLNLCKFNRTTGEVLEEFKKPYKCFSWRCEGDCRRAKAAQYFRRISDAFEPLPVKDVLFIVLTCDPERKDLWKDRYDAFSELRERWRSLRKAITRRWGPNAYVSTVEEHRSHWPHLNVVMYCPGLAHDCRENGTRRQSYIGSDLKLHSRGVGGKPFRNFKEHAIHCGFGQQVTLDLARSKGAVAGYVTKLAGEVEEAGTGVDARNIGEMTKHSQIPEHAGRHFRRLRSSLRFLPKPYKADDVTGSLERFPLPKPEEQEEKHDERRKTSGVVSAPDEGDVPGRGAGADSEPRGDEARAGAGPGEASEPRGGTRDPPVAACTGDESDRRTPRGQCVLPLGDLPSG
jgi:hypothetical protein